MKTPTKQTTKQLLDQKNRLVIPKYQRGYDWKEQQEIKEFFSDLLDCLKSKNNNHLFLGTMILDSSEETKQEKEIIDGQQRLTTMFLTLIACRDYAKKILGDNKIAQSVQIQISDTNSIGEVIGKKFIPSNTIKDVFDNIISDTWDRKFPSTLQVKGKKRGVVYQNRRVQPVYEYAYSWVKDYCDTGDKLDKFKKLLDQLYHYTFYIVIEVTKKEDAFEIFERTNARGRNLEIADLLKNYLFSKESEIEEKVEDKWKLLVDNSVNSLPRMLKYYYVSRKGYTPNRELYRSIRYYSQDTNVNQMIDELTEFSNFFKALRSKDPNTFQNWLKDQGYSRTVSYLNEAARSVGALNLFNITQAYPLIYSALQSYKKSKEQDFKKILTLLRLLETYHFINNRIGTSIGNEVEQLYARYSKEFFGSKRFKETFSGFEEDLNKKLENKEKFIAGIKATYYEENGGNINIYYIFDRLANVGVKDGQRIDLLNYQYKMENLIASYDIDHIYSQSEAKSDKVPEEIYHAIGNLMVIPKQINGILRSTPFSKKIDMYKHPEKHDNNIKHVPLYLKEFAQKNKLKRNWTEKDINERTTEVATTLYQILTVQYKYK